MDELDPYEDGALIEAEYVEFDDDYDEDIYDEDDDGDDDIVEYMFDEDDDDYYDDAEPEELGEFFGIRKRRRARKRAAKKRRAKSVMTAKRANTNRSAITKANRNIRRNAIGIKQVNKRVASVNNRVSATTRVNRIQSMQIRKMSRMQKALGVMEFVQAYDAENNRLDTFQLLKGAVASGMLGGGKGTMHNPYVLGAAGLFLRNGNLGGLLGRDQT